MTKRWENNMGGHVQRPLCTCQCLSKCAGAVRSVHAQYQSAHVLRLRDDHERAVAVRGQHEARRHAADGGCVCSTHERRLLDRLHASWTWQTKLHSEGSLWAEDLVLVGSPTTWPLADEIRWCSVAPPRALLSRKRRCSI